MPVQEVLLILSSDRCCDDNGEQGDDGIHSEDGGM